MSITLQQATLVIDAALEEARNRSLKPIAIIVLDAGGHPVAYKREDKASLFRHDIARAKAMGALGMGLDTRKLAERANNNPVFFNSVSAVVDGNLALSPGGNLIRNNAGEVIGAVGVSGDTADNDEACALAGIEVANLKHGGQV